MLKFGSKSDMNVTYKCTVRLLEDTEIVECDFQPQHVGKHLVEHVCRQLNLVEKDYFGLRYVDSTRQRHWLDPAKLVLKQVKDMDPILFSFRVKFYPPDPFRLKEEITRYQIYLQLKRDLLHGRLYCTTTEAALLGANIVQAELGDYDPEEHVENYVSEMKILLKQTQQLEEKMMELHKTQLKGQNPATTESNFLRKACTLDTYGVDPHPVKDHKGNQLYLGINHLGILTFQGSRKTNHFRWVEVHKINYEGKMFIIHLIYQEDARTKRKTTVGFKCPTGAACRHVWRCALEQMLFFTLPSSAAAPSVVTGGSFFSWSKFRYSGPVEKEILESPPLSREEPSITRNSLRRKASSVPATPSTPVTTDLGYSSLPRSNHSADCRLDSSSGLGAAGSEAFAVDNLLPLETVSEDQEVKQRVTGHSTERVNKSVSEPRLNGKLYVRAHKDSVSVSGGEYGEYYFRDSMDHSSSESQLVGASLRSTPVLRTSRLPLPPAQRPPAPPPTRHTATRRFHPLRVFIPSFAFAALSLILVIILVLETDYEILGSLRRAPEMITLRRLYYEPTKEFFRSKFSSNKKRDT